MNYLYNGIELQELPKPPDGYDKLLIRTQVLLPGMYYAYAFRESYPYNKDGSAGGHFITPSHTAYFHSGNADGPWSEWNEQNTENFALINVSGIKWSNFDIYNEDGTLYLAASEPVPVGSAPEVEPIALTMGIVGRIVRGLRCK